MFSKHGYTPPTAVHVQSPSGELVVGRGTLEDLEGAQQILVHCHDPCSVIYEEWVSVHVKAYGRICYEPCPYV